MPAELGLLRLKLLPAQFDETLSLQALAIHDDGVGLQRRFPAAVKAGLNAQNLQKYRAEWRPGATEEKSEHLRIERLIPKHASASGPGFQHIA